MGVAKITSDAARFYSYREKILAEGISLLLNASEKLKSFDKNTIEELGNLAYWLLPYAPGYAGKLLIVIYRTLWNLAGKGEKELKVLDLNELERKINELKEKI